MKTVQLVIAPYVHVRNGGGKHDSDGGRERASPESIMLPGINHSVNARLL
ncbi:hypothetical protein [Paenibacillus sp. L3-i20]|nr:hypothetical protein [Paenibacillus sp. L3-i20]GKU78560.1 hypothetical protein L3i20_v229570 [Paenibacillus sp. L3-i20]